METQEFVPTMKPFRLRGYWRRFSKARIVNQHGLQAIRDYLMANHPELFTAFEGRQGKIFGALRKHLERYRNRCKALSDGCKVLGCGHARRPTRRTKQLFCRGHAGYQSISRELFDQLHSNPDLYLVP